MSHFLTKYFENSFSDTLEFFEKLEKEQKMINVYGVNFRKSNYSWKIMELQKIKQKR